VPGKGDALMFYECNDDQTVRRYFTYIPETNEIDKVAKPFIKKLQRPEALMPATEEEFFHYWPPDGTEPAPSQQDVIAEEVERQGVRKRKHFDPNMTIAEAMMIHPKVGEVFAAFHLGGCSSCGVSEFETVAQVCMGYGVDVDVLLEVLEELVEGDPQGHAADDDEVATVRSGEE
jgi:hybrid cluster-associated redox disulfide protein